MHGDTGQEAILVRFFSGYGFTDDHPVVLDSFQILVPVGFIQSVVGPVIIFFTPDRIRRPAEGDGPGENIGAAEGGQEDENREGFPKQISLLFYKVTDYQIFFTFFSTWRVLY
ncbi:hypothetical protein [Akkermansia sp.]|uniref:hypothetical protein n=1 Tax=Akkermansia sp. TaxID=1872421 RepID=UPI003AB0106B